MLCSVVLLASCASEAGVVSTRSVSLPTPYDRDVPPVAVEVLPGIAAVEWAECDDQPEPWQCATLTMPLDYRRPDDLGTVSIAVTMLPATDPAARIGSLVLNPGGPGGSGVDLAWGYAPLFPDELLQHFDLVGFDPRGVGRSSAVDCGDLNRSFRVVERDCIERSGRLLPFVGTPNAARDMEQLRKALGDDQLTYLGFSYGTALGAVYALSLIHI